LDLPTKDRSIAVIVLAAGGSTRLGRPKQLLEFRGKTLLRHAVDAAIGACAIAVVVTSPELQEAITPALTGVDADVVLNPDWQSGMSSSIRVGITRANELQPDLAAVIIALCDQPLVTSDTLLRLINRYQETNQPIVASEYNDTVGVPALFDSSMFSELLALAGDKGAKSLILKYAADVARVLAPEAAVDIDSPADLNALLDNYS
jgi:molybdenum cofactor cytidylyltransferase